MNNMADSREYADISLVAIVRQVRRYWYLLAGTFSVCLIASLLVAFLSTPVYQSFVLLTPAETGADANGSIDRLLQRFGGGSTMFGGGGLNSRAVSLAALTSPYFTRAFIEENNLLPTFFADRWDAQKGEWIVPAKKVPPLTEGYELFVGDILSVRSDDLSGLVTVTINWTDAALAASWADSLVHSVNARLRAQAIKDADLMINYLNEEMAGATAFELRRAIAYLIETEIQKRTVAKVQKEYAFRAISPAITADPDEFVWPARVFVIMVGMTFGLFAGMLLVFLVDPTKKILRQSNE